MKRLKRIPDLEDIPPTYLTKEYMDKLMNEILLTTHKSLTVYGEWLPKKPTVIDGVTLVEDE